MIGDFHFLHTNWISTFDFCVSIRSTIPIATGHSGGALSTQGVLSFTRTGYEFMNTMTLFGFTFVIRFFFQRAFYGFDDGDENMICSVSLLEHYENIYDRMLPTIANQLFPLL